MNDAASKTPNPLRGRLIGLAVTVGSVWIVLAAVGVTPEAMMSSYRPHLPRWSLIEAAPLVLQVHIFAAVSALVIGLTIMALPKGRGPHKALGWTWVVAMATTAVSSVLLLTISGYGLSIIHGLSAFVMVMLPLGVLAIRRGDVQAHRRTMTGLFMGGLVIAGVLTLLPGRLMWRVFFG